MSEANALGMALPTEQLGVRATRGQALHLTLVEKDSF
jgi:hypothetical protein